ncbi:1,2-phenylacetyl-CoA epoxidase subunit PaaC [Gandjariella thermophila]|uniref:Putative phenylacetic acid degradation protein PaaC/phenylacetate-CoA oxygenase, PaaI subunit n=1 Tax=Gandjariella thermophila TaxID=1931992 RepID=A0A4D4J3U5_9PSEU|nr:1,2-phenylacetyl-CoA epoxidase subunit PaaC [Gandjariella thermophila]GDY29428.1 putative phenylacetic acid degradation protein PaaC/phenylacetate-CoA oxygenase, PaaI subunit [Gandjariella thermophila]
MAFDNAYESLTEEHGEETRWAYGTGFADTMAGVAHALPAGADPADLFAYCLMLGDDALVLAQRLAEWCSRAPELEEDVALANIGLDLLGQARPLYTRAGEVYPAGRPAGVPRHVPDEDALAYFRDEHAFRNVRLVEIDCGPGPGGDFAATIARLLVFSSWRLALLSRLTSSTDPVLAAVAAKGVKELAYHRDHAAQWTLRLGDGTEESHRRMVAGLATVWPLLDELFIAHPVELRLAETGVAADPSALESEVDEVLDQVLARAGLDRPEVRPLAPVGGRAGRDGVHTEAMGYLLAEMQYLARSQPEAVW